MRIEGRVTTGRSGGTESSGRPAGREGVQSGCGEWGPQEYRRGEQGGQGGQSGPRGARRGHGWGSSR